MFYILLLLERYHQNSQEVLVATGMDGLNALWMERQISLNEKKHMYYRFSITKENSGNYLRQVTRYSEKKFWTDFGHTKKRWLNTAID